jgi:hypothetical protein
MNFLIVNYEPWTVEKLMKRYESDVTEYRRLVAQLGTKPNRDSYVTIAKLLDLQAFGKTVVELLSGHRNTSARAADSFSLKSGIALDSIPLKWCKVRELSAILEIVNACFGPYGHNNKAAEVDTVKILAQIQ